MRVMIVIILLLATIGCSHTAYMEGRRLTDQGNYDLAITILYDEIKQDPGNAGAWRELGVAFYKKNDPIKASEALLQANNIMPDARTNLYLGLIHEKEKNINAAIESYRVALSLKPKSKTAERIQVRMDYLISQKMTADAMDAIRNESALKSADIPSNTIAVVDFDPTHLPPELAPISKGLAEMTSLDLAKVASLNVVDRLKIDLILKELNLGNSEYADPKFSPRMGRLVGSRNIVTGALYGLGEETIRLDGAVVNTQDSSTVAMPPTEGDMAQFFKLQKDFVFRVIDKLGIELTAEERDAIEEVPTESYLAFMAYSRGLDFKSKGMYQEAAGQFNDAARMDNGFMVAKQQQAITTRQAAAKLQATQSASQVETVMIEAADFEITAESLDRMQAAILNQAGFIRVNDAFNNFGNPTYSPPRIGDGDGVIIIRGVFDDK